MIEQSVKKKIIMEGLIGQRELILGSILPKTAKTEHIEQILKEDASEFLRRQNQMNELLLENSDQFQKYFHRFYHNHLRIAGWAQTYPALQKYVFVCLLRHSYQHYRDEISTIRNFSQPLNRKKVQRVPGEEYRNLFLQTLDACDGFKYICYNFQKRMKGLKEQHHYNQCIRQNHQPQLTIYPSQYHCIKQADGNRYVKHNPNTFHSSNPSLLSFAQQQSKILHRMLTQKTKEAQLLHFKNTSAHFKKYTPIPA